MRILITADAELPVPPKLYGGIERVIDLLVKEYVARGHEVALVAHAESASPATELFPWATASSLGAANARRNAQVLSRAVRVFRPNVIHSHSRLLWLLPLALDPTPKIMSYQREPTGRTIRLSRHLLRGRLHFTGISDYISGNGRARGGGDWTTVHNPVDPSIYTFQAKVAEDAPLGVYRDLLHHAAGAGDERAGEFLPDHEGQVGHARDQYPAAVHHHRHVVLPADLLHRTIPGDAVDQLVSALHPLGGGPRALRAAGDLRLRRLGSHLHIACRG